MTTALTVQTMKAPFDSISAGDMHYTMAAADTAGNTFQCTGREVVLILNPAGGSTYTVTITSVADEKNRSGTITSYSMAAGVYVALPMGLTNSLGWKSTAGLVTITANNAAVLIAVIRLPAGYPN